MPEPARSARGYVLGIDLGTTYSAAAVLRGSTVEAFGLGTSAAQIPTVVVHRENAEILTGEAAERRAATEPTRTAREFKRRLGDPIPIIVGGTPYGAEALMAEMLEAIVRQVSDREGAAPTTIVLTHPANYTDYKKGLLREAARLAGLDLDRVRLITEPEAAAIAYAGQQRIEPGEVIAVYDFGGGTFDAAVVRDSADGFELIGTPEGMERLGGIDFDQAVMAHVDTALGGLVSGADASDPQVLAGQGRLRNECRRAKEALSNDTDATISVALPGVQTEVRLTRDELEQMVRPRIVETVRALQRTITSAGLTPADVSRVLLVGGSSRMPIVAQVVKEAIGRPVSIDADPKLAIATGAALSAAPAPAPAVSAPVLEAAPTLAAPRAPSAVRARPRRRLGLIAAIVGGVVAAVVVVVIASSSGGSSSKGTRTSTAATSTAVTAGPTTTTGAAPASTSAPTTEASSRTSTVPVPAGGVVPLAFNGGTDGSGIPGLALQASAPGSLTGVAVGPDGAVYAIADRTILKVSGGQVTLVVELAAGQAPGGVTVGSDGAVFVTTPAGVVRVVDGVPKVVLDGPGAGLSPTLGAITLDGGGNLFIADNGTFRIVRLAPDGGLSLVAGTGTKAADGSTPIEGDVAATSALGLVTGLAIDRDGNLIIADAGLGRVRAVAPDGTIRTVAGGAGSFGSIVGLAVDSQRRIYVAGGVGQTITRLDRDGTTELLVGPAGTSPSYAFPTAVAVDAVIAVAVGPTGDLVFTDGLAVWTVIGIAS